MRVLCGGQIVEDITNYGRVHEMASTLKSDHEYNADLVETTMANIEGTGVRVCFKPLSGLLTQNKLIPLRYGSLSFEFEIVSNAKEPVKAAGAANTENWVIEDVQIKASVCTLDNSLENQIAGHLMEGKPLPINFHTFINSKHVVPAGGSGLIQYTRSLSRVSAVFITFDHSGRTGDAREFNHFLAPDKDNPVDFQLQIGSKKFPEMKMNSLSEVYSKLRDAYRDLKPLAVHGSVYGLSPSKISRGSFEANDFIIGLNTNKIENSSFSGYNMKDGSSMTFEYKFTSADINTMNFTILADMILQIRNSGVDVLD